MNQILLTNDYNNKNNKREKKDKVRNTKNNSKDIKKIIVFFAITILVFGIAIGTLYGYKLYKNNKEQIKTVDKPELSLESTEDEITIIAKSEVGISKIIYQWNDEEENVKELSGRTKQEEKIGIPNGDNTLKVKIIDQVGQETETTENFYKESSNYDGIKIDIQEPADGKIKIKIDSENPIKYVKYNRNDEEENVVEPSEEEKQHLEIDIDAKKENNNINVFVEDVDGNTKEDGKIYYVTVEPEFEVYREENRLYMKITHYKGFKKINFNINGKEFNYDETIEDYDPERTEVEYYFYLQEGENYVCITAYSEYPEIKDETKKIVSGTYEGRCSL